MLNDSQGGFTADQSAVRYEKNYLSIRHRRNDAAILLGGASRSVLHFRRVAQLVEQQSFKSVMKRPGRVEECKGKPLQDGNIYAANRGCWCWRPAWWSAVRVRPRRLQPFTTFQSCRFSVREDRKLIMFNHIFIGL